MANIERFNKNDMKGIETIISKYQKDGEIHFPENYSVQNALKSAFLSLKETVDKNKNPVLTTCTKESITFALLNTVIQGLSPSKKQIYYIPYGQKLTAMRSYHGTKAVLKRLKNVIDVNAQVIYDGDNFEYEVINGRKQIKKHEQDFKNIDTNKITGAYCIIQYKTSEGIETYVEVMNIKQIKVSWSKSRTGSSVAKVFPEEMCKRTVINRAAKNFINTSDDSDLLIDSFHKTSGYVEEDKKEEINAEIIDNNAQEELDFDEEQSPEPYEEELPETKYETPKITTPEKKTKPAKSNKVKKNSNDDYDVEDLDVKGLFE